jgi:hypothetical protein
VAGLEPATFASRTQRATKLRYTPSRWTKQSIGLNSIHWTQNFAIAPEAALARINLAINRPKKRAFGIFKLQDEYIGVVTTDAFEIWERQRRAVHALGSVRAHRGGTRIEVRYGIGKRTPLLLAVFFLLYGAVALGISRLEPEPAVTLPELAVAAVGAGIVAVIFAASASRQRAGLQAFIERLFAEVPRN